MACALQSAGERHGNARTGLRIAGDLETVVDLQGYRFVRQIEFEPRGRADINTVCALLRPGPCSAAKAKIAELEILHRDDVAAAEGDPQKRQKLEEHFEIDKRRVESALEDDVARVREG